MCDNHTDCTIVAPPSITKVQWEKLLTIHRTIILKLADEASEELVQVLFLIRMVI